MRYESLWTILCYETTLDIGWKHSSGELHTLIAIQLLCGKISLNDENFQKIGRVWSPTWFSIKSDIRSRLILDFKAILYNEWLKLYFYFIFRFPFIGVKGLIWSNSFDQEYLQRNHVSQLNVCTHRNSLISVNIFLLNRQWQKHSNPKVRHIDLPTLFTVLN